MAGFPTVPATSLEVGVDVQAHDAELDAIAGVSPTGLLALTGTGAAAARTIADGTNLAWTNPGGVAGNPTANVTGPPSATTLTAHGVLVGNGTSAIGATAVGSTGQYFRGASGAPPDWSTLTLPNTATQGDILVATGANAIGSLAGVATGQVLRSGGVGTVPAWGALQATDLPASGVTAGTYDGKAIDTYGRVTSARRQVFDVRDYGAVGDGTTDDTTAIQAAVTAAQAAKGGTIWFPSSASGYRVTTTISFAPASPTEIVLEWTGNGAEIWIDSNSGAPIVYVGNHGVLDVHNLVFRPKRTDNANVTHAQIVIAAVSGTRLSVHDCTFAGLRTTSDLGLIYSLAGYTSVYNNVFGGCAVGGTRGAIVYATGTAVQVTNNTFRDYANLDGTYFSMTFIAPAAWITLIGQAVSASPATRAEVAYNGFDEGPATAVLIPSTSTTALASLTVRGNYSLQNNAGGIGGLLEINSSSGGANSVIVEDNEVICRAAAAATVRYTNATHVHHARNRFVEGNGSGSKIVVSAASSVGSLFVVDDDVLGTNGTLTNSATTSAAWLNGKIVTYNTETTAGVGVVYPLKVGQDVASAGGGAQSTTIATVTPGTSGLYRVSITMSATTGDTVTATVSYTDAVNTTAQTLTPINTVVLAGNDGTSATVFVRANTSTAIAAKITNSLQTTTKASAVIERLN